MSAEAKRMAAMQATCPSCQSKPDRKCTQPTDNGRKPVRWVHLEREREAAEMGY